MSGIDPLMELLPDFGFILRASLSSSCACGDQGRKVWELFEEKYAWIYRETIHTRGERKLKLMFIQEHLQNQRLTDLVFFINPTSPNYIYVIELYSMEIKP